MNNLPVARLVNELASAKIEIVKLQEEIKYRDELNRVIGNKLVSGDRDIWYCGECSLICHSSTLTVVCCGTPCLESFTKRCTRCIMSLPEARKCKGGCKRRMCEDCYHDQKGLCEKDSG
jgi:hypothetical protein